MHFIYLRSSEQTSLSYISEPITPDCQGEKKRFVCAPTSHGCRSVVMQACKYVALRWAWAVMLDDVIQRILEYVISSLSLSLSPDFWGIPEL